MRRTSSSPEELTARRYFAISSTANAFGQETTEITELLEEGRASDATAKAVGETADVLRRAVQPSAVITPADDAEIGEILKTRIFESVDAQAAISAGNAYRALYEQLGRSEQLAGGPERPTTYGERVAATYPFHPELIRVLDQRLGAIPEFQRARGALKLLAEVVAGIYGSGDDTAIINVGDLDFSLAPVLNHLTVGLGRSEYKQVARSDFAGVLATHASALDADLFPGKPPYTRRVARTIFAHSLDLISTAGAGRNDWIIGTVRPGEDVAIYDKALGEAERTFWYLSFDGARWRFTAAPNVNAIIETEKKNVAQSATTAQVDELITKAFQNDGGAAVILFPAGPVDVPDSSDKLRVVVMDYKQLTVKQKTAGTAPSRLGEILNAAGATGSPRTFRNSLVFVVADDDHVETMRDRTRAMIAATSLAGDHARLAQFDPEIRSKIEMRRDKARMEARIAVNRCYRHVYYPSNERSNSYLTHRELPAQDIGQTKNVTSLVWTLLEDNDKVRTVPMSANYLKTKTWPDAKASTTKAILETFWRDHSLPIIRDAGLIREALDCIHVHARGNDVRRGAPARRTRSKGYVGGSACGYRYDSHDRRGAPFGPRGRYRGRANERRRP
jgi:hypothetical protein